MISMQTRYKRKACTVIFSADFQDFEPEAPFGRSRPHLENIILLRETIKV